MTFVKAPINRRELTWLIGGVVWVAAYLELRQWGIGAWYSAGGGAILGAVIVVIIAAMIC